MTDIQRGTVFEDIKPARDGGVATKAMFMKRHKGYVIAISDDGNWHAWPENANAMADHEDAIVSYARNGGNLNALEQRIDRIHSAAQKQAKRALAVQVWVYVVRFDNSITWKMGMPRAVVGEWHRVTVKGINRNTGATMLDGLKSDVSGVELVVADGTMTPTERAQYEQLDKTRRTAEREMKMLVHNKHIGFPGRDNHSGRRRSVEEANQLIEDWEAKVASAQEAFGS